MTMKWLTILQFLEIVAAYGIVTLFLPWLVLRKRFRRFSAAEQLTGYFFAGNFYIIYLVYLLQFLHISNRVTLTAGTVGPFLLVWIWKRRSKIPAASLAISVLFAFTGCGNSSSTDNTNTKQESSSTTETGSADELNEKRNDLYQQENQLFVDHKDAWDKAFGLMNKNAAGDAMSENYADSLASTVESNKDSFSEEEYETLCKDIETIRGIEEEIAKLEKEIAASDSSDSSSSKSDESTAVFKAFKGKDLDGNDVDDSLFAKNKVTVVNFWFSGCKPCVGELSKLNELNEKLKEMGGEVVGINTDTLDNNEAGIKEAKEILKAQGASYKNLTFDSNSTVGNYAGKGNIMAFPTTVLVDKDGNIVGEPFMGGIDDQSNYDQLMKQIQSVLDQK